MKNITEKFCTLLSIFFLISWFYTCVIFTHQIKHSSISFILFSEIFPFFSCLIVWYPTDRVCLPRQVKPLRIVQHSALCCSCQKNQNQASGGDGEYKYLLPVNPANRVNPISIPKYSKCIQNDIPIPITWWNFFLNILNITDIELLLIWAYILPLLCF